MSDRWDALLATLRARFGADASPDELAAFLATEGFDARQIGEVLTRLVPEDRAVAPPDGGARGRRSAPPPPPVAPPHQPSPPVRVPGPHEWGRYTPEAWGRVLRLNAGGIIGTPELERLLDRALDHGGGRVDLPVLRAVLDGVGLGEAGGDGDPTTIH